MIHILITSTSTLISSPRNAGLLDLVASSQQLLADCFSFASGLALLGGFFGRSSRVSGGVY